jgi:hypothetical protein
MKRLFFSLSSSVQDKNFHFCFESSSPPVFLYYVSSCLLSHFHPLFRWWCSFVLLIRVCCVTFELRKMLLLCLEANAYYTHYLGKDFEPNWKWRERQKSWQKRYSKMRMTPGLGRQDLHEFEETFCPSLLEMIVWIDSFSLSFDCFRKTRSLQNTGIWR